MKINHNIIRGILKWGTFLIFVISVSIKLKNIIKHGGNVPNEDPNDSIRTEEDGPIHQDYDVVTAIDDDEVDESDEYYDEKESESEQMING